MKKFFMLILVASLTATGAINAQPLRVIGSTNTVHIGQTNSNIIFNSDGSRTPLKIWIHSFAPLVSIGQESSTAGNSMTPKLTFGGSHNKPFVWGMQVWGNEGFSIVRHVPNGVTFSAFHINQNENIGIGTASPGFKLDVNGIIRAQSVQTSDERLKKDIKPLESNINAVLKLNSITYKSNSKINTIEDLIRIHKVDNLDEGTNTLFEYEIERQKREAAKDTVTHFGFIAQELRDLYPNLVVEDDEGYLAVNYIGMIPVLVEVIKELHQKIERLEGKGFEKTGATVVSNAKLYQNNPNPFSENTEIQYYVPVDASSAMICIYDLTGSQILRFDLRDRGVISTLTVRGRELKAGMYIYSLLVDGKEIDTKRMILTDK